MFAHFVEEIEQEVECVEVGWSQFLNDLNASLCMSYKKDEKIQLIRLTAIPRNKMVYVRGND